MTGKKMKIKMANNGKMAEKKILPAHLFTSQYCYYRPPTINN